MNDAPHPLSLPLLRRRSAEVTNESIDGAVRAMIANFRQSGGAWIAFVESSAVVLWNDTLGEHHLDSLHPTEEAIDRLVTEHLLSSGALHEAFRSAAIAFTLPVRADHVTIDELRACAAAVTTNSDELMFLDVMTHVDVCSECCALAELVAAEGLEVSNDNAK
jgi:hypothetical protein